MANLYADATTKTRLTIDGDLITGPNVGSILTCLTNGTKLRVTGSDANVGVDQDWVEGYADGAFSTAAGQLDDPDNNMDPDPAQVLSQDVTPDGLAWGTAYQGEVGLQKIFDDHTNNTAQDVYVRNTFVVESGFDIDNGGESIDKWLHIIGCDNRGIALTGDDWNVWDVEGAEIDHAVVLINNVDNIWLDHIHAKDGSSAGFKSTGTGATFGHLFDYCKGTGNDNYQWYIASSNCRNSMFKNCVGVADSGGSDHTIYDLGYNTVHINGDYTGVNANCVHTNNWTHTYLNTAFIGGGSGIYKSGWYGINIINCVFYNQGTQCIHTASSGVRLVAYNNILMPSASGSTYGLTNDNGTVMYADYNCHSSVDNPGTPCTCDMTGSNDKDVDPRLDANLIPTNSILTQSGLPSKNGEAMPIGPMILSRRLSSDQARRIAGMPMGGF